MTTFHLHAVVTEIVNGFGRHDDGVRDGDRTVVFDAETTVEFESEEALRAAFMADLKKTFPDHGLGGTYDIDRIYDVTITEVL